MAITDSYRGNTYRVSYEFEDAGTGTPRTVKQTALVSAGSLGLAANLADDKTSGWPLFTPPIPVNVTAINVYSIVRVEATEDSVAISGETPITV